MALTLKSGNEILNIGPLQMKVIEQQFRLCCFFLNILQIIFFLVPILSTFSTQYSFKGPTMILKAP